MARVSNFLEALNGRRPERLPVWFMRQAGRSLPEYREARVGTTILEACLKPDLAAEITLQPVRRHKVDAAIFFSDIMTPLKLAGVGLDIVAGVGPVIDEPVRSVADVERLVQHEMTDASMITEAVEILVRELGETPLIGFAGAPFTLAAYLVEGRGSRDHLKARAMMHAEPEAWAKLLEWCGNLAAQFLDVQVNAGARAVQLFDSWAGSLSRADYIEYVAPHSKIALDAMTGRVPRIHFGVGTAHILPEMAAMADVVGVDYRTPLDEAAKLVPGKPLQGNIDPAMLAAGWDALEAHARDVVERGNAAPSHIVNLGHGVPPTTEPEILTRLVELVHSL